MVLLQGPTDWRFLLSEVPLQGVTPTGVPRSKESASS